MKENQYLLLIPLAGILFVTMFNFIKRLFHKEPPVHLRHEYVPPPVIRKISSQVAQPIDFPKELTKVINKTAEMDIAKYLAKTHRSKGVTKFYDLVKRTRHLPGVYSLSIDKYNRIFIVTQPINIKDRGWLRQRCLGRFEIMIDFSRSSYSSGIRAINLDKYYGCNDHPHLSSTTGCFGETLGEDLEDEFNRKDFYEIVSDMIDFLRWPPNFNPRADHGYVSLDTFLAYSKRRPKDYSFKQYLEEHGEGDRPNPVMAPAGAGGAGGVAGYPTANYYQAIDQNRQAINQIATNIGTTQTGGEVNNI
jgi:hypothetical protein